MSHSDTHHSFSVELAIKYGMEKAALIHHFQHWIKFNRRKKSAHHNRDGHWWMYQKRSDIQAAIPYLTMPSIRHHCDELVNLGVLKKGNYNKLRIDTTIWYAFTNEAEFLGPEDSNNPYERGKPQSSDENLNPSDENLTPVPDPNSDPKATDIGKSNKGQKSLPSADAEALAQFFLEKIKEKKPDFKPKAFQKWAYEFDLLLNKDGRDPERVKQVICWVTRDLKNLVYVLSASKLREKFDEQEMRMQATGEKDVVRINREYALQLKQKYPEDLKHLKFDDKCVGNRAAGKEIFFNMNHEAFKDAFLALFGGQRV